MKRFNSRLLWIGVFVVSFSLLWLPTAQAYVDPGTGSFVFQMLIGAVLAFGIALKLFWRRVLGIFRRVPSGEVSESATSDRDG